MKTPNVRQEFFAELDRLVREPGGPATTASVVRADLGEARDAEESVLLVTAQQLADLYRPLRRSRPGVQEALEVRLLAHVAQFGQAGRMQSRWWRMVGTRLGRSATPRMPAPRLPAAPPLRALLGAAAALTVALLGTVWWLARPQAASAEMILKRADAAARSLNASDIRTFMLAQRTLVLRPGLPEEGVNSPYRRGEEYHTVSTRWFEAPNRVRDELEEAVLEPDGTVSRRSQLITVRDGTNEWLYRSADNAVVITEEEPAYKASNGRSPYLPAVSDVGDLLQPGHACSSATLRSRGAVAGRAAYVIEFGPSDLARCPPPDPAWRLIGRRVLWIDEATFFALKEERYDRNDGQLRSTTEVTHVEYNIPIDPSRFAFAPPPGASVRDLRPRSPKGS